MTIPQLSDHALDLGAGSWRRAAFSSIKEAISYCGLSVRRIVQHHQGTRLEAAQQALADDADRGGKMRREKARSWR